MVEPFKGCRKAPVATGCFCPTESYVYFRLPLPEITLVLCGLNDALFREIKQYKWLSVENTVAIVLENVNSCSIYIKINKLLN